VALNTQFSIATHILAALAYRRGRETTSAELAASVNASPSFVRRVLAKLSKAGLVETATGQGGACWLAKDAKRISLRDVYTAVGAPKAFSIHAYPEMKQCPVSCRVKGSLEKVLGKTQKALEQSLGKTSLAEILSDIKKG
jgi:Rrf2 family protein